ncbi:MAG: transglutaminase family protein [Planctomycetes bacterium]|nr:transglutaminase family protein [Planctomycetota bacterium]
MNAPTPCRAAAVALAALLIASATVAVPQSVDRIAFCHLHQGEKVGVSTLVALDGGAAVEERVALDRELPYHPLGVYTETRYAFAGAALTAYRLISVAAGHYREHRATLARGAEGRIFVERVLPEDRGIESRVRIPIPKDRPLLVFDLSMLTPLVRFCRAGGWRENFDPFHQVSPLAVLAEGTADRIEAQAAFWLKRTEREIVEIEQRRIHCTQFALHIGERDILVSVAADSGDVVKIEEPALGYEIHRTFSEPSPPARRGLSPAEAFAQLRRLEAGHLTGLDLRDRAALEAVTYGVDLPYRSPEPPTRPWQTVDARIAGERLAGTIRVACGEGEPPVVPGAAPPAAAAAPPAPEIQAAAERLRAGGRDDAAFAAAVVRFVARDIGLVYNIDDPVRALAGGFGNVRAKVELARALLGAGALPARDVSGLVCTGRAFVFHRWLEVHLAARGGWLAIDPTLDEVGHLSPLHLTLGASWNPPQKDAPFRVAVEQIAFRSAGEGARDLVRWPDGERRVWGFYKRLPEGEPKLYGYLASRPRREGEDRLRLETDLILDYGRIGLEGYLKGEATETFDTRARPHWFSFQTWLGGKRHTLSARIQGLEAVVQETGRDLERVALEEGSILAANSFYNHWALFFSTLDPGRTRHLTIHVLVPGARSGSRLYRYSLIRRDREPVAVPALGLEAEAWVFDVPERSLRFWVTDARLLVRILEQEAEVEIRLEDESLRERF